MTFTISASWKNSALETLESLALLPFFINSASEHKHAFFMAITFLTQKLT